MLVFLAIRLFKHSRTLSTEEEICAWSEEWSIRQRRGTACHAFLIYWSSAWSWNFIRIASCIREMIHFSITTRVPNISRWQRLNYTYVTFDSFPSSYHLKSIRTTSNYHSRNVRALSLQWIFQVVFVSRYSGVLSYTVVLWYIAALDILLPCPLLKIC